MYLSICFFIIIVIFIVVIIIPENTNFSIINKSGNKIYSGITPSTVNLKVGDSYFIKAKYTVLFNNL